MTAPSQPTKRQGDLSVTALYTSQAWINGGFEDAELFATRDAKVAFKVTNFILGLLRIFKPGPVLPCSMAQRHAMFDHVVRSSGATQVIEIAAGLSRRGAAFSKDPNLRYVEIDLPGMIASKRELLERTEAGQLILQRPNLTFVPADVRDIDLESCVEPGRPACFAAEGLFMFLAAAEQRALWQRIARALAKAPQGTFVFDLIPVVEEWRAGRVGRLLDGLLKRATNGATYVNDNRTRHDIASDLKDAGFATVEFLEPAPLLDAWRLPFPKARTQVLMFHCTTGHPA